MMNELSNGVTLYSSQDGDSFSIITDIDICRYCGKRTIACPHMCLKEKHIKIPAGTKLLKIVPVEPDMRMSINSAVNTRLAKTAEDAKFCLLETLTSLEEIWEDIGVKNDQKDFRCQTLGEHIQQLLQEILAEEVELKSKIKGRTEEYKKELEQICIDLQMPPKSPPSHLSLLELEIQLRNDLDRLNKQKHDNLKILRRLRAEEQILCDELVMPQHEINFLSCPSNSQLRELETNVKFLKSERDKRLEIFEKLKSNIIKFWTEMEMEPQSEFEQKILDHGISKKINLSAENLESLKNLKERLDVESNELCLEVKKKREELKVLFGRLEKQIDSEELNLCEIPEKNTKKTLKILNEKIDYLKELKKLHIKNFIECIRKELLVWWEKCYIGQDRREVFRIFFEDVYTEETLAAHEEQLNSLKQYYKENKDLFKLILRREAMWEDKLMLESQSEDTLRFNNRGGALMKQLKKRQFIDKQLPKLEKSLKDEICLWEKENNANFVYKDVPYLEHIYSQRQEYEIQQQITKEEKKRAKKQELSLEIAYGTKRKVCGTPTKSKKNYSRVNDTHSTIGTPSPYPKKKKTKMGSKMDLRNTTKVVHSSLLAGNSPKCKERIVTNARKRSIKRRSIRCASHILKDSNIFLKSRK